MGLEIGLDKMQPNLVYVQKFADYFLCKGKTPKEDCYACLVGITFDNATQYNMLQKGINSVKNSIITTNRVGVEKFLSLVDTNPGKLPDIRAGEQKEIKVIYL